MIPGVISGNAAPSEAPSVMVIAREKTGKSVLATTLFDWPNPGDRPLVLAFDPTGPDSCMRIGKPVDRIIVRDEPGATYAEKVRFLTSKLEQNFAGGKRPYSSIVVDCASTMVERLLEEARRRSKNPDPRSHYGDVLSTFSSFFWRVHEMGVPTAWIAWLAEPETDTNGKFVAGGPSLAGKKLRALVAGKVQNVVLLERQEAAPNTPGVCSDGFVRLFRTKPFGGINCDGRYALPNPMPANLGWVMHYMTSGYQPQANGATTAQVTTP